MLFLVFKLGDDRYALEAARVMEVVPLLEMNPLPMAPEFVAGVFNYRGRSVPAVDLCQLLLGRRAAERLSTRILIVRLRWGEAEHLLGLIAEQATGVIQRSPTEFKFLGVTLEKARFLGPVLLEPTGDIRWLREEELLSSQVQQLLFDQTVAAP